MREIQVRQVTHHGQVRWQVLVPAELSKSGKRSRRFFQNQDDAMELVGRINADRGTIGEYFHRLRPRDQEIILRCLHRVDNNASQIEQALDAWLKRRRVESTVTLGQLRDECVSAKERANRRPSYVANLKNSLRSFVDPRLTQMAAEVTPKDVEGWLNGNGWAASTRQGLLKDIRTMFNYGMKHGYLADNPALRVDRPLDDEDREVGILTPIQVRKLLDRAKASDTPLARWLAVQLFGGLRKSEAKRLTEAQIRVDEIEVGAKTKTRTRRFVPINDTLRAWLALPGTLPIKNIVRRLRRVRGELRKIQSKRGVRMKHVVDIPYPRNCLRHSFCSYCLPIYGEEKESAWAGHSPEVAISKYRELVTESQAKEFWAIKPE